MDEQLEQFFEDVVSSFQLAMDAEHVEADKQRRVFDTVRDYVSNQYGE